MARAHGAQERPAPLSSTTSHFVDRARPTATRLARPGYGSPRVYSLPSTRNHQWAPHDLVRSSSATVPLRTPRGLHHTVMGRGEFS